MNREKKIPKGWIESKVAELCEYAIDCINKTAPTVDSKTPYKMIRTSNIRDGRIDFKNVKYVNKETFERWTRRLAPKKGDIILTREAPVGEVGYWDNDESAFLGQRIIHYRTNKNKLFNKYLLNSLMSLKTQFHLKMTAFGATVKHIKVEDALNIPILLPPLPEQKAIADLLSTWDEAIEKTEQLIAKKQKSYEAQLSKHLSFDITERIKLKKFLKEVSRRNRDLSITQVLSVTNSKGFARPEDQFDRQVASDNLSNYKIISKGEYAYNPSRINVGSIARLDGWDFGVLSPMYIVFEIKKSSELNTDLFLHWLNSHEAKQRIKLSAQGSVRETVSFDDFCAIGFPKIEFKEQKALAEYFSLISREIDALKALSEKYKIQKRGLIQKMLTGEWRVKQEIVNQYVEA
jgi:type I restriction enzyme S subunit